MVYLTLGGSIVNCLTYGSHITFSLMLQLLDHYCSFSPHYNPHVIRKAAEEKVIIFCLPSHSSYESQPLDKGPFGPLKLNWRHICQNFLSKNPGKVVTRFTFSHLFNEAWSSAMNMKNTQAGFRCTGIYPLNRLMLIPNGDEHPNGSGTFADRSGLKFVPFYSPMHRSHASKTASSSVNTNTTTSLVPIAEVEFTEEEITRIKRRFEERFDIESDERFNLWKQIHYPEHDQISE